MAGRIQGKGIQARTEVPKVVKADADDRGHGLFAISVAAELTGLHPQTIRIYEREGLVTPARSGGGTRRYSRDDIDRLNQIAALMTTGLNLEGVRQVLQLRHENRRLQGEVDDARSVGSREDPSSASG
jgi:MerR family transcriptional regulator/heat shock protein HspR